MSLRRVDDDDASAPSSIDVAIGALADRLPVATRLNHVLTIGAKFRLEQQQRKPVNTDAYRRLGWYKPDPVNRPSHYVPYSSLSQGEIERCEFFPDDVFSASLKAYKRAVHGYAQQINGIPQHINGFMDNPTNFTLRANAIAATMQLAANTNELKEYNNLREEDCYIVLNFMRNATVAQPNSNKHKYSKFMMIESLHHDKFGLAPYLAITPQQIANMVTLQCTMSNMHLRPQDGLFAYDPTNYPAWINPALTSKLMDKKMCDGDTQAMFNREHRRAREMENERSRDLMQQTQDAIHRRNDEKRVRRDGPVDRSGSD